MQCTTTRAGMECGFMSKNGCTFQGGTCQPALEACLGCDRAVTVGEMVYCKSYPDPMAKWRFGNCNFATHIKGEASIEVKMNPLKASKRAAKGRKK
ncbi:MAG: PxxKW family cysteine-rich protein [Deltaproteobacteria bacterium]|nr:PxxKW family cysteine-rich protein [Deltaproteobacteria bacterium]